MASYSYNPDDDQYQPTDADLEAFAAEFPAWCDQVDAANREFAENMAEWPDVEAERIDLDELRAA